MYEVHARIRDHRSDHRSFPWTGTRRSTPRAIFRFFPPTGLLNSDPLRIRCALPSMRCRLQVVPRVSLIDRSRYFAEQSGRADVYAKFQSRPDNAAPAIDAKIQDRSTWRTLDSRRDGDGDSVTCANAVAFSRSTPRLEIA